jgi:hypothetical protein
MTEPTGPVVPKPPSRGLPRHQTALHRSGARYLAGTAAAIAALALLLAYFGAVPAQADPLNPGPYQVGSGLPFPAEAPPPVYYDYDSVDFWLEELVWDPEYDGEQFSWGTETYTMADIDRWIKDEPEGKYRVGTIEHVLTRWVLHGRSAYPNWNTYDAAKHLELWKIWLRDYVRVQDNRSQGAEGEEAVDREEKFTANDFQHDTTFPGGGQKRFDFFLMDASQKIIHIIEVKSGGWEIEQIEDRLDLALELGTPLVDAYFLKELTAKQIKDLEALAAKPKYADKVELRLFEFPAEGRPRRHKDSSPRPDGDPGQAPASEAPTGPLPVPPGALENAGQHSAESPATEVFAQSPGSEEEAQSRAESMDSLAQDAGYEDASAADMATDPLGGVDFSTLELRYVSDTYDGGLGSGVDYAYQVDPAEGVEVSYGGQESAQLASDSFFTWLALHPSSFTVNLNPDEPDRIIDAEFGRTDAGRVLLEADLQMKKSVADFIHPDSDLGAQYWEALQGETKCISMRQWIVPKPAVVHENDDELFILDAPLEVKMETEYLETAGVGGVGGCTGQSESDTQANEQIYRDMILPELEEAINTAPEYADLRRVYASRVAAEWFRDRSLTHATAFSDVIDSGDASAWYSRTPWDPEEVFDRYVQSYTEGEFEVEHTTQEGNYLVTYVYVYGGVNFSDVPEDELGAEAFDAEHPELDAAVEQALLGPASEEGANLVWLGGQTTQRPPWDPFPQPASPLSNPWFYVLTGLPVFAWLAFGGYLTWRRPRRAKGSVAA